MVMIVSFVSCGQFDFVVWASVSNLCMCERGWFRGFLRFD